MTAQRQSVASTAWPPYLNIKRAVAYTGYSRSTIARAVAAGALPVYGRPGGARGTRVFAREDLDRWLRGDLAGAAGGRP